MPRNECMNEVMVEPCMAVANRRRMGISPLQGAPNRRDFACMWSSTIIEIRWKARWGVKEAY